MHQRLVISECCSELRTTSMPITIGCTNLFLRRSRSAARFRFDLNQITNRKQTSWPSSNERAIRLRVSISFRQTRQRILHKHRKSKYNLTKERPIFFLCSLTEKIDFTTSSVTRSSVRMFILIRRWLSDGPFMQQKLFVGDTHGTIHQQNSDKRQEDVHGASTNRRRGNRRRHDQISEGNFNHEFFLLRKKLGVSFANIGIRWKNKRPLERLRNEIRFGILSFFGVATRSEGWCLHWRDWRLNGVSTTYDHSTMSNGNIQLIRVKASDRHT